MPPYLAERDMEAFLHAFPELAPAAPRPEGRRYYSRKDIEQDRAARREKYAAIRRDFDAGMSERAIERERAASTEEDPPRANGHERPARHHRRDDRGRPRHRHRTIWQHLADDHSATVACHPLRHYIVRRRADMLSLPGGPD
jgi:hypothetical protein